MRIAQTSCLPTWRVTSSCRYAQAFLRQLCSVCSYADALLRNLWRWLCSPSAALTSPALRQSVGGLMRKALAHLVAEMRKLGATIVAADMTSIILATGKRNLTAAVG